MYPRRCGRAGRSERAARPPAPAAGPARRPCGRPPGVTEAGGSVGIRTIVSRATTSRMTQKRKAHASEKVPGARGAREPPSASGDARARCGESPRRDAGLGRRRRRSRRSALPEAPRPRRDRRDLPRSGGRISRASRAGPPRPSLGSANPRAVRLAGKRTLDLVEADGGSLARDLARRDFTVNAMAVALPSGGLIDPHGGARDLRSGVLRMLVGGKPQRRSPAHLPRGAVHRDARPRAGSGHGGARAAARPRVRRSRPRTGQRRAPAHPRGSPRRSGASLGRRARSARARPGLPAGAGPRLRAAPWRLWTTRRSAVSRRPGAALLRLASLSAALGLEPGETGAWLRHLRYGRDTIGDGRPPARARVGGRARRRRGRARGSGSARPERPGTTP